MSNEEKNEQILLEAHLLPAWTECNVEWRDFENFAEKEGLAGLQIKMASGPKYLIGEINELAGVCDDCRGFPSAARVVAFRRLVPSDWLK